MYTGEGYTQKDGVLTEVTCESEWVRGPDGLVTSARIRMEPGGWDMAITPVACGALLLTRDDGRASHFPRAWATAVNHDGRKATGW